MARLEILSTSQRIAVVVAAVFYVAAGALHFIKPALYLRIMPPYVLWHVAMPRISGAFEILGGLGLLVTGARRAAAWVLVALLIAVFPANIYLAMHPVQAGTAAIAPVFRWGRLPLQFLLICWLLWCTGLALCFLEALFDGAAASRAAMWGVPRGGKIEHDIAPAPR